MTAAAAAAAINSNGNVGNGNGNGSRRPAASIYELTPPQREELRGVFLSLIVAGPNGCHMWIGSRNPKGYGRLCLFGRRWWAHRTALEFSRGSPIPGGMYACHSCAEPRCVNGDHLRAGSPQDNVDDKIAKGGIKYCRGEKNPRASITEAIAGHIKWLRNVEGLRTFDIACHFGIAPPIVSDIAAGRKWAHVEAIEPPREPLPVVGIRRRV
jgi:hypothetical protein